jgi:hypothetical protein
MANCEVRLSEITSTKELTSTNGNCAQESPLAAVHETAFGDMADAKRWRSSASADVEAGPSEIADSEPRSEFLQT